jgi:hypothetical protein
MYRKVNDMFGDLVKVTPSSKIVGDMAMFMVQNNLQPEDVYERGQDLAFPQGQRQHHRPQNSQARPHCADGNEIHWPRPPNKQPHRAPAPPASKAPQDCNHVHGNR